MNIQQQWKRLECVCVCVCACSGSLTPLLEVESNVNSLDRKWDKHANRKICNLILRAVNFWWFSFKKNKLYFPIHSTHSLNIIHTSEFSYWGCYLCFWCVYKWYTMVSGLHCLIPKNEFFCSSKWLPGMVNRERAREKETRGRSKL